MPPQLRVHCVLTAGRPRPMHPAPGPGRPARAAPPTARPGPWPHQAPITTAAQRAAQQATCSDANIQPIVTVTSRITALGVTWRQLSDIRPPDRPRHSIGRAITPNPPAGPASGTPRGSTLARSPAVLSSRSMRAPRASTTTPSIAAGTGPAKADLHQRPTPGQHPFLTPPGQSQGRQQPADGRRPLRRVGSGGMARGASGKGSYHLCRPTKKSRRDQTRA